MVYCNFILAFNAGILKMVFDEVILLGTKIPDYMVTDFRNHWYIKMFVNFKITMVKKYICLLG